MEVLYLLVPLSVVLAIVVALAFLWAGKTGQFDDLDRFGEAVLADDEAATDRPREGDG